MAVDLKTYIGNNQVSSIDLIHNGVDASVQETSADVISFAESDWATIKSVCNQGKASTFFKVGDVKSITDSSSNVWTIRIIDIQRGRYKYTNDTKVNNIVCEFTNLCSTKYKLNNSMCKYSDSTMNVSTLPGRLSTFTDLVNTLENMDIYQVNGNYNGVEKFSAKFFLPAYAEMMIPREPSGQYESGDCIPIYKAETNSTNDDTTEMGRFQYYIPFDNEKFRKVIYGASSGMGSWWFRSPYLYLPSLLDMYGLSQESNPANPSVSERKFGSVEPYSTNIYIGIIFSL